MTTNHNHYLDLAFQLAKKNLGKTGLNPTVGSVVVKNNAVISSAVTSINGRPHSEFNALNKVKNISGATLYTTLEPCTHLGKTPPCVNIILKKKLKMFTILFMMSIKELIRKRRKNYLKKRLMFIKKR